MFFASSKSTSGELVDNWHYFPWLLQHPMGIPLIRTKFFVKQEKSSCFFEEHYKNICLFLILPAECGLNP
jgi:hypothetical protein